MKRYSIPLAAFAIGTTLIVTVYFGIFTWLQGWNYAYGQFRSNAAYVIPIWLTFGLQSAIYAVLRFRLFLPVSNRAHGGVLLGTSGSTSVVTMIACCLHHVADVLPILGVSAAATFLVRYQRPFMRLSLAINIIGILIMLAVLYRAWQKHHPLQTLEHALEVE